MAAQLRLYQITDTAAKGKDRAVPETYFSDKKLAKAAQIMREGIEETLAYMSFRREHWLKIRTTNPLERINREIRRRTRVVGAFPDGNAAVLLVAARLRHIAGTRWGSKLYMDVKRLENRKETAA